MSVKGEVDYSPPMDFGMGVDVLRMEPRGTGVVGSAPAEVGGGGGQQVEFRIMKVDTIEKYQEAFTVNVQASVNYGLFHGSASFDFAQSQKFSRFSNYLLASVRVINPFRQMHDIKITDSARKLLENGKTDRFREQFGDRFVQGIQTGGSFYSLLEFTSESDEDQRKMAATIDVGMVVWNAKGKFQEEMQKFQESKNLSVYSFQQGGADTTQVINVDGIIEKASKFPMDVRNVAVPQVVFLQDYKILDLPPGPNFIDIENANDVLKKYYSTRNALLQKLNDIDYILLHDDQFVSPNREALVKGRTEVASALDNITSCASKCADYVKDCKFNTIAMPSVPLPDRKPQVFAPDVRLLEFKTLQETFTHTVLDAQFTLQNDGKATAEDCHIRWSPSGDPQHYFNSETFYLEPGMSREIAVHVDLLRYTEPGVYTSVASVFCKNGKNRRESLKRQVLVKPEFQYLFGKGSDFYKRGEWEKSVEFFDKMQEFLGHNYMNPWGGAAVQGLGMEANALRKNGQNSKADVVDREVGKANAEFGAFIAMMHPR
jgi:hypothetical protein